MNPFTIISYLASLVDTFTAQLAQAQARIQELETELAAKKKGK